MPGWTRGPGIPVSMAVPGRGARVKPQRPEPTGWGEGQSRPSAPVCFGRPGARSEDLASRSPWPGASPFPVLGPVPGLAPNSCLRADCPLCSPLPPDGEAPVGSETASQAVRIQERFYFSSSWVARKDYKSQLGYPRPHTHPLPSHKTDTVPSPCLRKSQILQSESYTPLHPHPQLCHSARSGRAGLRDQGPGPQHAGLGSGAGSPVLKQVAVAPGPGLQGGGAPLLAL